MSVKHTYAIGLAAIASTTSVDGQALLHEHLTGVGGGNDFALIALGVLDPGPAARIVVGSPGDVGGLYNNGKYEVWDVAGNLLHSDVGPFSGCFVGRTISVTSDFTGDGYPDLIAGSGQCGAKLVDGLTFQTVVVRQPPVRDTWAMGDLDGDGLGDFFTNGGPDEGILFGSNPLGQGIRLTGIDYGPTLPFPSWAVINPIPWQPKQLALLGDNKVVPIGDLDGDGHGDVLVGNAWWDWADYPLAEYWVDCFVEAYSGATGLFLGGVRVERDASLFGQDIAVVRDVTGDGVDDFYVLAAGDSTIPSCAIDHPNLLPGRGSMHLVDGARMEVVRSRCPAPLQHHIGEAKWKRYLEEIGDVNKNGSPDILLYLHLRDYDAPPGTYNEGWLHVIDGLTFEPIWEATDNRGLGGAKSVAKLGDVDLDGFPDFVTTSPGWGGLMSIFSATPRGVVGQGGGVPRPSGAVLEIGTDTSPLLWLETLGVNCTATDLEKGEQAFLLMNASGNRVTLPSGGELLVGGHVRPAEVERLGARHRARTELALPKDPAWIGRNYHVQYVTVGGSAATGYEFGLSQVLELTFEP